MIRFALLLLALALPSLAADRPNIVLILADDMGYGDVQALNPDSQIPTPALDSLVADGMTFTDAHSPSSVCTPTRYATLTGRYCWRSKLKRGVLNGYGAPFFTDEVTVAQLLRNAGYHTEVIGKWHLGLGFQKNAQGAWDWEKPLTFSPNDVGFDRSYVIPASLDFPPYLYVRDHQITELPTEAEEASKFPAFWRKGERAPGFIFEDCLDHLRENVCSSISENAKSKKPFFLYFPLTAPHKPALPHPRFRGKSGLGDYGDFILQVDSTIGEVLKAIDEAGIRENTVVFYTSDNGSYMYRYTDPGETDHLEDPSVQGYHEDNHCANGPLRGTKADIWEAGHRVPFFVRWPGVVKAGSQSDVPICHTDFLTTAAEIAGLPVPNPVEAGPDSHSLLAQLKESPKAKRGAPVIHHSGGAMFAIRDGKYKLVLGSGSGGRQHPRGKRFERPYHLYDLEADLGETKNLIDQLPEVAKRLEAKAMEIIVNGRSR